MTASIVLLARDPNVANFLATGLRPHFVAVHVTVSRDELRRHIADHRPAAAVLDVEAAALTDVKSLHQDFPALPIVCTHRVPDEEIWMAALEAGAVDVCPADDLKGVLASILRSVGTEAAA